MLVITVETLHYYFPFGKYPNSYVTTQQLLMGRSCRTMIYCPKIIRLL